jgi:hypothetical protein
MRGLRSKLEDDALGLYPNREVSEWFYNIEKEASVTHYDRILLGRC